MASNDPGGATWMTAFDFNNDGASEMVYREDGGLHIIDGVILQRTTISVYSTTLIEGPIVADVDGDGQAEILVMGRASNSNNTSTPCYIYCFKSNGEPWIYARPVWNQYMYSGIHINDNLTVPSHPINPAQLVFPNGKRPLNNFLQQHSLLNINGGGLVSVILLPDLTILSAKILSLTSSQLTVEVKVLNLENAVALANIPVSLSARNGNNYVFINSQNITTNIAPGTTATVTLVYDITGYTVDACKLTVNANSAVFPNNSLQEECNYTNNTFEFLSAFDDNLTTSCQSMPDTINVLDNDILPSTCPLPLVEIVSKPAHVTASLKDNKIIYSSSQSGLDTIVYRVICGTDSAEAKVYITVGASGSAFVDDVWYFGENIVSGGKSAGIRFVKNANEEYEAQDASGESWVSTWENSLVVSSPYCDGQNIFYANHSQLYNSLHDTLKNGAFIGHKSTCDGLAACYMGDNKYLFFTVTNVSDANGAYPRGINAYVVDMNADNGRGELTDTIIVEPEHKHMSEFLELVARAGTSDQYWLIYAHCNGNCTEDNYYNNELRVRLVNVSNPDAPQVAPVSATISKSKGGTFCMATSQQQNRIAVTDYITGIVSIFDFDNVVGTLTLRYNITGLTSGYVYGIEFSPDGNQLYFASYNGSNARLYQYDISGATPVQVIGSPLKYWQTTAGEKGGGLKLGPDGKVYITLANSNKVGAISEPNATTDLVLRYNANALTLGITYNGLAFSAGLTKPAIMSCDMNTPPTTQADSTTLCVTSTSTKVNVLVNDDDADPNDTVYLTSAEFVNASDADLATLTVNAVDSTITLTVKPNVNIAAGHVFEILYNIKDDGLPASQCATGILKITTYPTPNYPDIRVRVCPDLGKSINLSKYIDAFNVTYLKWESISPVIPITDPTASGTIMTDDLNVYMRVHTFEYTVGNLCASSNIRRKVYLETLKQGKMRALRDSIVICYERAEAVNINQIFGIDACGTWSFEAFESDCFTPVNNIDAYITESTSPAYGGAVIMNGKAIYKNTSARKILITYTPADDSCLAGRAFTIKIVLTEN
jgi:sugar lactone lactonase YvrE